MSESLLTDLAKKEGTLPSSIINYIHTNMPASDFESRECTIIGGSKFIAENYHASPSMFIRQFGHWTIARLDTGDAICLDANSEIVRIFDVGAFLGLRPNQGSVMAKSGLRNEVSCKVACTPENILLHVIRSFHSLSQMLDFYGVCSAKLNSK